MTQSVLVSARAVRVYSESDVLVLPKHTHIHTHPHTLFTCRRDHYSVAREGAEG